MRNRIRQFLALAAVLMLLWPSMAFAAVTKTNVVLENNTTLTAGGGLVTKDANTDLTGSYRTLVRIKFTNGATGPTVPAQCQIQLAGASGGTYNNYGATMVSQTGNNVVTDFVVDLPDPGMWLQFSCGNNTAQNVTLRIEIDKITAI